MRNAELIEWLTGHYACDEAYEWVASRDLQAAWAECPRGDWMLWLCHVAEVDIRLLTLAKAECAAIAWEWMPNECKTVIEAARAFGRGKAEFKDIPFAAADAAAEACRSNKILYYAADAAIYAVIDASAHNADYSALSAARAATAHGNYVAYTTIGDYYAKMQAGKEAMRAALKRCADIVREIIPFTEIQKLMK